MIFVAWAVAPLLTALLAAGLGYLVMRASGLRGTLFVLPAGFFRGTCIVVALLGLGAPGWVGTAVVVAGAAGGAALAIS